MISIATPEKPVVGEGSWRRSRPAGPCALIIFGITGDLSKRLLFPALCNLAGLHLLPDHFAIVGFALSETSEAQLRERLKGDLKHAVGLGAESETIDRLVSRVRFLSLDFSTPSGWERLGPFLSQVDREYGTAGNYLFYLATAPEFFLEITRQLAANELLRDDETRWRRIVIEKPFGHDLHSARELNRELLKIVHDDQILRIDHYLGKETVQNVMVFRFANGIFEPIWNR